MRLKQKYFFQNINENIFKSSFLDFVSTQRGSNSHSKISVIRFPSQNGSARTFLPPLSLLHEELLPFLPTLVQQPMPKQCSSQSAHKENGVLVGVRYSGVQNLSFISIIVGTSDCGGRIETSDVATTRTPTNLNYTVYLMYELLYFRSRTGNGKFGPLSRHNTVPATNQFKIRSLKIPPPNSFNFQVLLLLSPSSSFS